MQRRWLGYLCGTLGVLVGVAAGQEHPAPYRTSAQIAAALKAHAAKAPKATRLVEFGKSAGGRPLLALRISFGGADASAPAVFVGANIAGPHTLGTEAAMHLIKTVLRGGKKQLGTRVTLYVAPILNPDAHDARFGPVARAQRGNGAALDRDRDGVAGEDPPDDLDGDKRITTMRIPDPTGRYLPDPKDPRALVLADPLKGEQGRFRLEVEGKDDDGDGVFNEELGGVEVDRNFAHAFPYPAPEAGPWPSSAPEAKHVMDFLLARRNVALAIVLGPANTLLKLPPTAPPAQVGSTTPRGERRARRGGRSAPETKLQAEDAAVLKVLAKAYAARLKEAGQDPKRPAEELGGGGLTPWLYFHYGVLTVELDVWGLPGPTPSKKAPGKKAPGKQAPGKQAPGKQAPGKQAPGKQAPGKQAPGKQAPDKKPASRPTSRPTQSAEVKPKPDRARARAALAYLTRHRPTAIAPWTPVTLPDGRKVEVGGLDPFATSTPPAAALAPALAAHTREILSWCRKLAELELAQVKVRALATGLFELEVTCRNKGFFPTHSRMAVIGKSKLPVRLELDLGKTTATLVTGQRWRASERLEGSTGTLRGTWLIRAKPGTTITVRARSQNAGSVSQRVTLGGK